MLERSALSVFISVALILVFMPGPNTLYIIARTIEQGRKAGIVSCLGVQLGTVFHIVAATLGLSALLLSSAAAFSAVKYAGAVYLIYLGIKTLMTQSRVSSGEQSPRVSLSRIFYQGIIINLLNPKTALFFLAFLPQFLDPSRGSIAAQILFLGAILVIFGTVSDCVYALLAGSVGDWLRGSLRFVRVQRYFAGSVYLGLGAATALGGCHKR